MLKFENPSNGRYYYLETHRDLLNDLVLTITRGGAHSRIVRHFGYNCETTLIREIERIKRIRLKRGYELVL